MMSSSAIRNDDAMTRKSSKSGKKNNKKNKALRETDQSQKGHVADSSPPTKAGDAADKSSGHQQGEKGIMNTLKDEISDPKPFSENAVSLSRTRSTDSNNETLLMDSSTAPEEPIKRFTFGELSEFVATPKGCPDRPLFFASADLPRKRPQSLLLPPNMYNEEVWLEQPVRRLVGTTSESSVLNAMARQTQETTEMRARRLGAELNLATPAGTRKKLSSVPVPRAWSSLVLKNAENDDMEFRRPNLSPDSFSAVKEPEKLLESLVELESIKRENEQLQRSNQQLERENAKLRTFLPTRRSKSLAAARIIPDSPLKKDERRLGTRRGESSFGIGHPESELILQAETEEDDDLQTSQTKAVIRQIFSINTLVKSVNDTITEDRTVVSRILRYAKENKRLLEEAQLKIQALEEEITRLKSDALHPQ